MTQFPQVKMLPIDWFETFLIQNEFFENIFGQKFSKKRYFCIFSEENLEPTSKVPYIDENQNV